MQPFISQRHLESLRPYHQNLFDIPFWHETLELKDGLLSAKPKFSSVIKFLKIITKISIRVFEQKSSVYLGWLHSQPILKTKSFEGLQTVIKEIYRKVFGIGLKQNISITPKQKLRGFALFTLKILVKVD